MKKFIYAQIEKWLKKYGLVIVLKKDLDVLLSTVQKDNPEMLYPHWESSTVTTMDFDGNNWTVIYIVEQRRSKDGIEFENARQSFKSIDKNLDSAIRTTQKAGNSLLNSLSSSGKNLFNLED